MIKIKSYQHSVTNQVGPIINKHWAHSMLDRAKNIIYIIEYPGEDSNWIDILSDIDTTSFDKLILSVRFQVYTEEMWEPILDFLKSKGVEEHRILITDSNINAPTLRVQHVFDPIHFRLPLYPTPKQTIAVKDRKNYFVSLSAIPRVNRIMFTKELLERNLDQFGIITCGSSSKTNNLKLFDSEFFNLGSYRNKFPVLYDKYINEFEADDFYPPFMDAIYNVVIETCYENCLPAAVEDPYYLDFSTHPSPFVTEKSTKALLMRQIPIFLAIQGYVELMRNYGFDVFDDIVDHSYDLENDPIKRITMVANELHRLVQAGHPIVNLEDRFDNNIKRLSKLITELEFAMTTSIINWAIK